MQAELPAMTAAEYVLLSDFVLRETGIQLSPGGSAKLEGRLRERLLRQGCETYSAYLARLRKSGDANELEFLIGAVTNHETSFFRNAPQLRAFQENVLPMLFDSAASGGRPVRLWSAGCSSGEEAYTLAMLALQHDSSLARRSRLEVIGFDIDPNMIRLARAGRYRASAAEHIPARQCSRFFAPADGCIAAGEELRTVTRFYCLNLMEFAALQQLGRADAIFLRNVMIYFSDDSRRRLLRELHSRLQRGGYLFLGHSETLQGLSTDFESVDIGGAHAYLKKERVPA